MLSSRSSHLSPSLRLGIMGGTFDPVHVGHLKVAAAAREAAHLQRVIFVTAHCPPHKSLSDLTPVGRRHAMVELAIKDMAYCEASLIEAERRCPTYAGDTIEYYKKLFGTGWEVFFITGLDALLTILNWDNAKTYPGMCRFIAATRPGCDSGEIKNKIPLDFLPSVTFLEEPNLSISSTDIRSRVRNHRSIEGLVPQAVRHYILRNGLYRT